MTTATIEALQPGIVRLRWPGHYVDFDACPVRGLSPRESATEWAQRVLGRNVIDKENNP